MGAVEAAHAGIGLGPDDEVERGETELQGGRNDSRITPPIDESGKKTAIAKVAEGGADPSSIKSPELGIGHLAGGHQKLAVRSARHVAGNRNIVGFVGQDQPRLVIVRHKDFENGRIGRIAANDSVSTHGKDIAKLHDGLRIGLWRQRTRFRGCGLLAYDDLINFGHGEACDLDRGVLQDEFLQFEFKLVDIPAALLAQAIQGHPHQSAFRGGKMIGADAGYVGEAQKLGRLDAYHAVEHGVSLIDQHRIAKAQTADCGGDLAKMSCLDLAHVARRNDEICRRTLDQRELRHKIVANETWCG